LDILDCLQQCTFQGLNQDLLVENRLLLWEAALACLDILDCLQQCTFQGLNQDLLVENRFLLWETALLGYP
jgi:hypothetical protein